MDTKEDDELVLPIYAFQFNAFDRKKPDAEDEYASKTNQVDVTVIATNKDKALEDAKNVLAREHYQLEEIVELTDLHPSRYVRW
jgi:hypothetical protein